MESPENQPTPDLNQAPRRTAGADSLWIRKLYDELRALAQHELKSERANHTLSATALVNEAYLKLMGHSDRNGPSNAPAPPIDRGVFFGLAAQAMRRILVDHARGKRRIKRGSGRPQFSSDALDGLADDQPSIASLDAVVLDDALSKLAIEHDQAARVVELRFFAGLTDAMIAEILQINERTVRRHWTFAKAWLAREMQDSDDRADRSHPP